MKYLLFLIFSSLILACDPPPTVNPVHTPSELRLNGDGIAYLPDGSVYEGEFQAGLFHGQGTLSWKNGDTHAGQFVRGQMNGQGTFRSESGDYYQGEYRNGLWHGQGHYQNEISQDYVGKFVQGLFSDQGKYTSRDGDIYEGEFKAGRPHGQVTIHFATGASYSGKVKDWIFEGEGVYTINEVIYSGHFKNGKLNGKGKIVRKESTYEGDISDWVENGKGTLLDNSGNKYVGQFQNGDYHGTGKFFYKNGDIYTGNFQAGLYHGKGEIFYSKPKGGLKTRTGWWEYGAYQGRTKPSNTKKPRRKKQAYKIEDVLYQQPSLLKKNLTSLLAHRPEVTDLYFISFAPYDRQDVFMNEAKLSTTIFNQTFQTQNRSISLINNKKTITQIPLATNINLRKTLGHISGLINTEEDIVFLYITSHGSKKKKVATRMRGVSLEDLTARNLKDYLDTAKIKWKVIVVSACYSGGFIEFFKDPYTLIMTASSDDHVSFGCSNDADLTYFGRAFFKDSLRKQATFAGAFAQAHKLITQRENKEGYSHSNPQIHIGEAIREKLARWRLTLAQRNQIQPD